jgi:hypothetical protein
LNPTPTAPADPVDAARNWLERAAGQPDEGLGIWSSRIGEVPIRFRCSDSRLAELYRSRLVSADSDLTEAPVLRFDLLETERLGWPAPHASVDRAGDPADTARRLARSRLAALMPPLGSPDTDYPWVFFEPATGRGLILIRTAADLPPWSAGAPFALLLHLAFAWRGWRFLHAAAIGASGAGALLAGPSGTGKSGTTLAGLGHGFVTTGDDYVLVAPGVTPTAWPVYRVLKQDPAGLSRAGRADLAGRPLNWSGKVELDLSTEFPSGLVGSLALRVILLPEIANLRRTEVRPAAPTEAFSAIAASMLTQLPGARIAGFSFLTRLTRSLPAYHLSLSTDPEDVARAVRGLLQ